LTKSFRPLYGPGADSASSTSDYQAHRADNLATFLYRLSGNLGVLITCNPQGLPRPVDFFTFTCAFYCIRQFVEDKVFFNKYNNFGLAIRTKGQVVIARINIQTTTFNA